MPITEQAIAAAGGGFQHTSVGSQRLANSGDVDLKRVVLDDGPRPDAFHELVLGDELARRANEDFQDFERSASDWDRNPTRPQFAPTKINLPFVGLVHHPRVFCRMPQRGSGLQITWELAANKKLRERCHWQGARAGQCKTPDDG
jgi:hypothetical protein